jgi:hypothetical protein
MLAGQNGTLGRGVQSGSVARAAWVHLDVDAVQLERRGARRR